MESVAALENLEELDVAQTQLTDDGLMTLTALEHLRELDVRGTKVTEKGVAEFSKLRFGVVVQYK